MENVVYVISARVKEECVQEFLDLLMPVLDAMRHEQTFVNAVLHRDPADPTSFMLYETWTDANDVAEVQVHRPYRKDFWDRLPELLRTPRDIQTWKPMRSDITAFHAG